MTCFKRMAGALVGATMLAATACQTGDTMTPATLTTSDAANVEALRTALSAATGRAQIEILDADYTQVTHVSVLPPPLGEFETHSLALPTEFDIFVEDGTCTLVQRDTGESFPAPGVSCSPVED